MIFDEKFWNVMKLLFTLLCRTLCNRWAFVIVSFRIKYASKQSYANIRKKMWFIKNFVYMIFFCNLLKAFVKSVDEFVSDNVKNYYFFVLIAGLVCRSTKWSFIDYDSAQLLLIQAILLPVNHQKFTVAILCSPRNHYDFFGVSRQIFITEKSLTLRYTKKCDSVEKLKRERRTIMNV